MNYARSLRLDWKKNWLYISCYKTPTVFILISKATFFLEGNQHSILLDIQ